MVLTIVTVSHTMDHEQTTQNVVANCYCHDYRLHNRCIHYGATVGYAVNLMRLSCISTWCETKSTILRRDTDWDRFQIPSEVNYCFHLWHVFLRRKLSVKFRTFCVVTVDYRLASRSRSLRRRMQCLICTGKAVNRMSCIHESQVMNAINSTMNEWPLNDTRLNVIANKNEDSDGGYDLERQEETISYVSSLPRSFFPCVSDELAVMNLINLLMFRDTSVTKSTPEPPLVGMDLQRICPHCDTLVYSATNDVRIPRVVMLHALHHGSLQVRVIDLKCNECHRLIPYDGANDALLSARKEHLFTRELLDAWLWDVCGSGGTLRVAFYSWSSKNCKTSASCHRLGNESKFARQRGNEAFNSFLMTLCFPKDQDVFELFSCATCERTMKDGSKRIDGVVMDGSAVGILGKLPNFQRVTHQINAVSRIADREYIMRTSTSRRFIDSIMVCAKNYDVCGLFNVPFKNGLWIRRQELVERFFNSIPCEPDEFKSVSRFLRSAFEHISQEARGRNNTDVSDDDELNFMVHDACVGKLRFKHKVQHVDVRRTLIDFGRCWCSGSIAGGALRDEKSIEYALHLKNLLEEFSICSHCVQEISEGQALDDYSICENCCNAICEAGITANDILPSVSGLCFALADVRVTGICWGYERYLQVLWTSYPLPS